MTEDKQPEAGSTLPEMPPVEKRMICKACCTEVCSHGKCPNCHIRCKDCMEGELRAASVQQEPLTTEETAELEHFRQESEEMRKLLAAPRTQPGPQMDAADFIWNGYDWDASGRGYVNKQSGKLELISEVMDKFVQYKLGTPRTQGREQIESELSSEELLQAWEAEIVDGEAPPFREKMRRNQILQRMCPEPRIFELLKDINRNSYACAYQQNTFPGDSDPCGQCSPCRIDKVLGEGWETKSELAPAITALTYEQEVHALLCASAANTEGFMQYLEAQAKSEKGEARKLTKKCLDWKTDDLRRIRLLIPKAFERRELAQARTQPAPRCPKCGGEKVHLFMTECIVRCPDCREVYPVLKLRELFQFFSDKQGVNIGE